MENVKEKLLLVLMSFIFLVSACTKKDEATLQNQEEPSPKSVVKEEPAQSIKKMDREEANDKNDKITIVYARTKDDTGATAKLIDEYNNQNTNVFVKYQELPFGLAEAHEQLGLDFSSGDANYDIVDLNFDWNAEFASKGYIVPIDEYIEKDKINLNGYLKSSVDAVTYNNEIWAMPKSIHVAMMYFRNDLVSKSPQNWDELISISHNLKSKVNTNYSYVFVGKESDELIDEVLEIIYSYGGRILDNLGSISIKTQESTKALEKFKELYYSDFVPKEMYRVSHREACNIFTAGDSVFMRNYPFAWTLGNKAESKVMGKFSIAPIPAGDAGRISMLNGTASAISATSEYPEEAWDFVKFMTGYEGQKKSAVYGSEIPSILEVFSNEEAIEANPHFTSQNFKNTVFNAIPKPVTPYFSEFKAILNKQLWFFLYDEITSAEMLINIENEIKNSPIKAPN